MVSNYDKNTENLVWFWERFKKSTYGFDPDEVKDIFSDFNSTSLGLDAFIEQVDIGDETLKKYLQSVDPHNASMSGFTKWLQESGIYLDETSRAAAKATLKMKALSLAINAVSGILATLAISFAVKAISDFIHRVENAKNELNDLRNEFSSNQQELEKLNEEIVKNKERMKELLSLGPLSYVEQQELDRLKEATAELQIQEEIKRRDAQQQAKEVAKKSLKLYKKEFGDEDFNWEDAKEMAAGETPYLSLASDGIEGMVAALIKYNAEIEKAKENGDEDLFRSLIQSRDKLLDSGEWNNALASLQQYSADLKAKMDFEGLTAEEQKAFDTMQAGIRMIFQATDPAKWNEMALDNVFNTKGIEVTKEQLIELQKEGKLTPEMISSWDNLNKALEENHLVTKEGQSAAESLLDEVRAWTREGKQAAAVNPFEALSKRELITSLNGLSEGFESLDKIYSNIKGKDPFNFALLDDSKFKETFSSLDSYVDFIETISDSPKDIAACQDAFDSLISEWLTSTNILNGLNEENKDLAASMLKSMGIANADAVVSQTLAANKKIQALNTQEAVDAAAAEVISLYESGAALDYTQTRIAAYALQKATANGTVIDTSGDVNAIMQLMKACGESIAPIQAFYKAKQGIFDAQAAKTAGMSSQEAISYNMYRKTGKLPNVLDKAGWEAIRKGNQYVDQAEKAALDSINDAIKNIQNFKFTNYSGGPSANKSGGSGSGSKAKETEKEFDWVKQKIDDIRESYEALNEEAGNSENTFANQLNFLNAAISKQEELIEAEKLAAELYRNQWEQVSSTLSDEIKGKIMSGDISVDEFAGKQAENIEEAKTAWETYKSMLQSVRDDEKAALENQKAKYQKQIEWGNDEIEHLRERSSIEQESYSKNVDYLNQAIAKSEQMEQAMVEKAETAKKKWEELKSVINSIDIAKIMNGTLNLENYAEDPEYYGKLSDAMASYEDFYDVEESLQEQIKTTAEIQKEAYEKAMEYLEAQQDYLSNIRSTAESTIELIEALGGEASAEMYQNLIANNSELISLYEEQLSTAEDRLSEVEHESAEYYEILGLIESCNQSIIDCKIQQAEWNEAIMDLPIRKLERYQTILKNIKQDLQNWIDEQETLNRLTGKEQYQNLIDISDKQIKSYVEQIGKLQEKLKNYEWNSDKYNETVTEIQDIEDEISSIIQAQYEWNNAILNIPIEHVNKYTDNLQNLLDAMNEVKSDQDAVVSAVVETIERETEALNDQRDEQEKIYDEKIESIQEVIDGLKEAQDEEDKLLAIERAKAALEKAQNQKTQKVLKEGEWQWQSDIDAINDAREELDDALLDKQISDLEKQIETLEKEKEAVLEGIDKQIEGLEKISEKWQQIAKDAEYYANILKANELLGEGWKDKVLAGKDDDIFNDFREDYLNNAEMMNKYQEQIDANNRLASLMSQYVEAWQNGSLSFESATKEIESLMSKMGDGFSAIDNLSSLIGFNGSQGKGGTLSEILETTNKDMVAAMENFSDYFEIVKTNQDKIDKFTLTWKEIQENILKQLEELEKAFHEKQQISVEFSKKPDKESSSGGISHENIDGPVRVIITSGSGKDRETVYDSKYDPPEKRPKFHDGGFVEKGKNLGTDEEVLRRLAEKPLLPDEVPAILKIGEAVLTPEQIHNVSEGFKQAVGFRGVPLSSLPNIPPGQMSKTIDVGGVEIIMNGVQDVAGFAREIKKSISPIFRQIASRDRIV